MILKRVWSVGFFAAICAGCSQASGPSVPAPTDMQSTPLVSRAVLFGNPDRAGPQISQDAKHIAWLADVDGVMNVWVAPVDNLAAAKAVTQDKKRGIRIYRWAYNNDQILYQQDIGGDENWHIYATDIKTMATADLTPLEGVNARIQEVSHKYPDEILVAINDRDKQLHDVHRVNIRTAERKLVQENPGYVGFTTDSDYRVRLGMKVTPDGGSEIYKPAANGEWALFTKIPSEDMLTSGPMSFDKSGEHLYMQDSRGRDTGALVSVDMKTNKTRVLASDGRADVDEVLIHPTEENVQAVSFNYDRTKWQILDGSIRGDLKYLERVCDGEVNVTSRSLDDKHWIVTYVVDNGPVRYYHYDRGARSAKYLFSNRSKLENLPLAKMYPRVIKARDGLNLVCYLSLPVWADPRATGKPSQPLPMVLDVHGGPWGRDDWGFDGTAQWLTNRGYAVMNVNFRGSTGFGKKFTNAGDKEWAAKMHNDLLDAVQWAIDHKIADPKKVGIMGGSYGGYATLVGLTFTPDVFACGVDIVGPSNLVTLLQSVPPYWKPMLDMMTVRVGDHRTEDGRKLLESRSPLTRVASIKRPLLIGQGANDPRVKQAEADQIVKAMQDRNIPVTYVLFPDEGHGFARPENRMSFNAIAEAFLAAQLGGRCEPTGDDFKGSSVTVPQGADQVPGLANSLPRS